MGEVESILRLIFNTQIETHDVACERIAMWLEMNEELSLADRIRRGEPLDAVRIEDARASLVERLADSDGEQLTTARQTSTIGTR